MQRAAGMLPLNSSCMACGWHCCSSCRCPRGEAAADLQMAHRLPPLLQQRRRLPLHPAAAAAATLLAAAAAAAVVTAASCHSPSCRRASACSMAAAPRCACGTWLAATAAPLRVTRASHAPPARSCARCPAATRAVGSAARSRVCRVLNPARGGAATRAAAACLAEHPATGKPARWQSVPAVVSTAGANAVAWYMGWW